MREAQRARTRKQILRAAAKLMEGGNTPSLEEVADAAEVSRATAYRYFPGIDALLGEAAVDTLIPEVDALFGDAGPQAPLERVLHVDETIDRASRQREAALRIMLARSLERSVQPGSRSVPLRQNRRVPMIEAALAPAADGLPPELVPALAMIVGTEGMIALSDVVRLEPDAARRVRAWAIEALLRAAGLDTALP